MTIIAEKQKCSSFYIPNIHHTFNAEYLISIFNKQQPLGQGQIKNIDFVNRNDTFEYKSAFVHFTNAPKCASFAFNKGGIKVYYNSCEYFRILPNNRYLAINSQNKTWSNAQVDNEYKIGNSLTERIESLECLIFDLQLENATLKQGISEMKRENETTVKKLCELNYNIQEKPDYQNMDSITSWALQKNMCDEEYADMFQEPDLENQVHNLPFYKEFLPTTKYVTPFK